MIDGVILFLAVMYSVFAAVLIIIAAFKMLKPKKKRKPNIVSLDIERLNNRKNKK